ncbi:hypothetical protein NVP1232O_20 [Vibrio phage 1.232.O._10N.261.51.E11]|nr:hypothetical protein NVP1232O_20 [Vibrio phage 1.232.O._10N.261.51.E11]
MSIKTILFMDKFHVEQDEEGNDIHVWQSIHPDAESRLRMISLGELQLSKFTAEQYAAKDVPAGLPYKIVDTASIQSMLDDATFRNAWEVDEAELTDGVGADSNLFPISNEMMGV